MKIKIKITTANIVVNADLNASETAKRIWDALPIEGAVNTWGEEIYFAIPVDADLEDDHQKTVVELGDLGYWPPGSAFCLFFGQTPASTATEIRPASAVNVVGRMTGDFDALKRVPSGASITIARAD